MMGLGLAGLKLKLVLAERLGMALLTTRHGATSCDDACRVGAAEFGCDKCAWRLAKRNKLCKPCCVSLVLSSPQSWRRSRLSVCQRTAWSARHQHAVSTTRNEQHGNVMQHTCTKAMLS